MPYFGIPIRNGLPIGLGSVAGFGISPFSPESLFENGEQGAWYDPSDYNTLFTDSAGTTPVTGVEQFVGLMLDKSQGLVLGSELITGAFVNGGALPWPNFSASGTGFTASVSGVFGTYQVANPNGISIVNGKWYKVFVNVTQSTDDVVTVSLQTLSTGGGLARSTSFTFGPASATTITGYVQATSTTTAYLQFSQQGTTITFDVASVSVRELPGNHAFQTSSAKRPKLAARYNLLTYSEEFNQGVWTKTNTTISVNSDIAPNGTTTADRFTHTNTADGAVTQTFTYSAISYIVSVYFKYVSNQWVRINGSGFAVWFDIQNGVVGSTPTNATELSITVAENGWYKCSFKTTPSAGSSVLGIINAFADNSNTRTLATSAIWGADLRPASQATGAIGPTYQRVAAATVYDTAGFLPYLAFDGLDDSMSTNSIDFSGTQWINVFAGVRKLQDATRGIVVEHIDNVLLTNGFNLNAPFDSTDKFRMASFGNNVATANATTGVDAPITVVASGIGSITQDVSILRLNGAQVASNTSDQGAGGYGNNILSIGARNNASLFFNGWLTSLIVRGAQSTQSQIEATEAWVNGKTGAY